MKHFGKFLSSVFAFVVLTFGAIGGANALTVTYNCGTSNGTVPTDSTNYNSGDTVTVKPNTCTVPSGKHFAGYVCGSTNVAAGNDFTITANTTCTAQWENGKFAVKTYIEDENSDVFRFQLTAAGTFIVDCGEDGWLEGQYVDYDDGYDGKTIIHEDVKDRAVARYECMYETSGVKTITFDGTATGDFGADGPEDFYSTLILGTDDGGATTGVTSISGNLATLFPILGTEDDQIPNFIETFYSADLTSIPSTLFNGYTTGCNYMFHRAFMSCHGLTSIPHDLFSGFTTGAQSMFSSTFLGCSGLTSIPHDLFSSFTTGAQNMFGDTFSDCTGLTSIPHDLFSNFTSGASYMFSGTFHNCTGLTSLPAGLFSSFTTGGSYMFSSTFSGCTNLSGYIPQNFFAGLIANNVGANDYTDFMTDIFNNTGLATSCPSGTARYETPYDSYWDSHVSCANIITINWTGATAAAIAANNAGTAIYGGDIRTPQSYDPSQVPAGKRFVGWKFRKTPQNNG